MNAPRIAVSGGSMIALSDVAPAGRNLGLSSASINGSQRAGSLLMVCPVLGPAHGRVVAPAA
jgi:hypothetical protein